MYPLPSDALLMAEDRSKTGMTDGVKDSDVFVAVISESYFAAPFCCLEFHTALKLGKPIVVVWNQSKKMVQDALGWIPPELEFLKLKELLPVQEDVQMAAPCAKRIMAQEMQPYSAMTGDSGPLTGGAWPVKYPYKDKQAATSVQSIKQVKQAATVVQSFKQEINPASVSVGAPLENLISRLEKLEKGLEKGINLGVFDRLVWPTQKKT